MFEDYYEQISYPLPELPLGYLRPSLRYTLIDSIAGRPRLLPPFDVAVFLLLYAHEVLIDDPLNRIDFEDSHNLRRALEGLLLLQPLAELGAVRFKDQSFARHPVIVTGFGRLDDFRSLVIASRASEIDDLLPQARRIGLHSLDSLVLELLVDVCGSVRLAQYWDRKMQPIARSRAESAIFEILFTAASLTAPDLRNIHLQKLAMMHVPSLRSNIDELVAVRRSNENFAEWRVALSTALTQVQQMTDDNEHWREQASAILHAELGAVRERIHKATQRSPALASLTTGTAGFALAGLGAIVGSAMGNGRVLPAVAGAGAAKTIESAANYVRMLRDRRKGRALLELALTFSEGAK